jgi:hypothetical protein
VRSNPYIVPTSNSTSAAAASFCVVFMSVQRSIAILICNNSERLVEICAQNGDRAE